MNNPFMNSVGYQYFDGYSPIEAAFYSYFEQEPTANSDSTDSTDSTESTDSSDSVDSDDSDNSTEPSDDRLEDWIAITNLSRYIPMITAKTQFEPEKTTLPHPYFSQKRFMLYERQVIQSEQQDILEAKRKNELAYLKFQAAQAERRRDFFQAALFYKKICEIADEDQNWQKMLSFAKEHFNALVPTLCNQILRRSIDPDLLDEATHTLLNRKLRSFPNQCKTSVDH